VQCISTKDSSLRKYQIVNNFHQHVKLVGEVDERFTIQQRMDFFNTPAFSVAVINDGRIDWTAAYGVKDITAKEKANCTSLFQTASISKPVTMLASLKMAESKFIDLDKGINSYLLNFQLSEGKQSNRNHVTFRNLLTHTSGVMSGGYSGYTREEKLPSTIDILMGSEGVNSPKVSVVAEPNSQLMYSGGGYTLVQAALEDTFQQPFEVLMQQWVLSKLAMSHSGFSQPLPEAKHAQVAKGHDYYGNLIVDGWHNYPEKAAAGLWSTPYDMALFLIEIGKGYKGESRIFSQGLIKSMLKKPIENHAYGFRLKSIDEELSITHFGANKGYRAGITYHLNSGDGAVYFSNSAQGLDLGLEFLQTVAKYYQWPSFNRKEKEKVAITASNMNLFTGKYLFDDDWQINVISLKQNEIIISLPEGEHYNLVAVKKGEIIEFISRHSIVKAIFERNDKKISMNIFGATGIKKE
jgi:CubicO group peptidase (beta-lactamase class C family)